MPYAILGAGSTEENGTDGASDEAGAVNEGAAVVDPRNMSDEEKKKRGDMLRNAPAVDVAVNQITATKEKSARKVAEEWWDNNVSEPQTYETEVGEVEINRNSVESSLAHRYGQAKLDAIYVFCRALHDNNTNRLYVHEVFIEENIKKGNTLQTAASQPHGGVALYRDILANVLDFSDGKVTNNSANVQENEQENAPETIKNAEQETNTNPTEAQKITHDEAMNLIAEMENRAEIAPDVALTIENWDKLFADGKVNTPIGEVKMGENQFTKLTRQGREGKLGMVKPTLENPDVIIEDASEAKEGDVTERGSSYVFVKAFKKADGSRYYYFTSVTVSKDGKEVVISNQEKRKNAIANLPSNGKLVWKHADDVSAVSDVEQGLYSSQGNMSDPTTEGTDAPQTNVSSASKVTNNSINVQENEQENAEKEKKITEESLKQFIGDWEKDPENATKVVDEKGQPIVVYRGGGRLGNIEDDHNNTLYIELSTDNSYWSVNSGGVFRRNYGNNKEEVWSASEEQNKQSATDNTLQATDKSDNPVTSNGNVSNTSASKGSNNSANVQEKEQENAISGLEGYSEEEIVSAIREDIEAVNEKFNKELDDFKEKKHQGLMHLGNPLEILRACGVNAKNLTLSPTVLHRHLKEHGPTVEDMIGLAKAVQIPILVYAHGKNHPNMVVVTEMDVKGGKLSVSLELDKDGNVVEISNIRSIHSKDAMIEMERLSEFSEEELKEALRWVDKEKVSDWLLRLPYEDEHTKNNPK